MRHRSLIWTNSCYAAIVAAILVQSEAGPERWWWAGVNLFLPQFVWALPAAVLLPLTVLHARRWSWLPAAALLLVVGPLMGFRWNGAPHPDAGTSVRVMSYNVQLWQRRNIPAIIDEIRRAHPDVLLLQDARGFSRGMLSDVLRGRDFAAYGQYVIASRFPIVDSTAGDISYRAEPHTYLRAQIDVDGKIVTVVIVHFITPRDALMALRGAQFWSTGIPVIEQNLADRISQADAVADDLGPVTGPVIVAGDLNAPPHSLASRVLTGIGLVDTFSASGRGYGYTFGHTLLRGQSFLRLDRILVSRHFLPVRTWAGGADGSDHRPVVADIVLQ